MAKKEKPAHDPATVAQVSKWILSGASAHDVADAIRQTFPEADPPALILSSMEEFRRAANFQPDVVRGWAFEAAREVYRRALESNDTSGALRAVKVILELTKYVPDDDPPTDTPAEDDDEPDAD